ncbi:MAG: NYN domain-containing protein [Rhodomicrobiaceae bacterium]
MLPGNAGVCLSALFIDFDNIYLSLKNRDEEAASRFARNPSFWLAQLVSGALVRTDTPMPQVRRRIAVGRCYGNPIPRRSGREGAGDPSSFAFVRHSFMRAGLEVVDCPHLTSQFKNSSDIRIACDVRDFIDHPTRFDEFIILSGDADFTPVLLSLRSHNRQTIIYTNDYTSPYYKAFSDGRIREEDLIRCLMEPDAAITDESPHSIALESVPGEAPAQAARTAPSLPPRPAAPAVTDGTVKRKPSGGTSEAAIQSLIDDFKVIGDEILALVRDVVENSEKPVPLAYLADRAQKSLGHPKTIGTNWAGSGGFLNFLTQNLPEHMLLTEKPPHFVYDPSRHRLREDLRSAEAPLTASQPQPAARPQAVQQPPRPQMPPRSREPLQPAQPQAQPQPRMQVPPPPQQPQPQAQPQQQPTGNNGRLAELQRSITRIYEACQAPPLPPSEYQLLFTLIAAEVRENGFAPERSSEAVISRAAAAGLKLSAQDVSFVIDAVDEIDPWLEHTRSPAAVARAYRDYVLTRCAQVGLDLTDDEYQLIQVWFGASQWTGSGGASGAAANRLETPAAETQQHYGQPGIGLPSPGSSGEIPLPSDFGKPQTEREREASAGQQSSNLRYSFLKHG